MSPDNLDDARIVDAIARARFWNALATFIERLTDVVADKIKQA